MATRNLYERKSVEATFLYAVHTGDTALQSSTLSELESSGVDTRRLLLLSCVSCVSCNPSLRPFPPPTKDTYSPCPWPAQRTPFYSTIWHAIRDALHHGRIERAVRAALSVTDSEDLRTLLLSFSLNTDWLLLLPGGPKDQVLLCAFQQKTIPCPPCSVVTDRSFSVDPRALASWGVPSPSVSLLMGAPLWVAESTASPWWKAALLRYGVSASLQGSDDDATEAFYTECFPKDIPDEWSAEERAKSHGLFVPSLRLNPWASYFLTI